MWKKRVVLIVYIVKYVGCSNVLHMDNQYQKTLQNILETCVAIIWRGQRVMAAPWKVYEKIMEVINEEKKNLQ